MDTILASFFSDVATVCGHEATLHANFMHQLLLDGVPAACIEREHAVGGKRIDLVLSAIRRDDVWVGTDDINVAFEFKGGAYNKRNALSDEIDAEGYCSDMEKLASLRQHGIECWFVCTDMVELGVALLEAARLRVAAQCARRGIHFAYHAQGRSECMVARAGTTPSRIALRSAPRQDLRSPHWQDCLPALAPLLEQASFTEDTATGFIYHALQQAGLSSGQISLETYFRCAKGAGRMQKRPDICVFGDRVAGRFNLYLNGDPKRHNDRIKIGDLRALIEIKGSTGASRGSGQAFITRIATDIEKLAEWRCRFEQSGYLPDNEKALQPEYVMIAFDNRKVPLASAMLDGIRRQAEQHAVHFHYLRVTPR